MSFTHHPQEHQEPCLRLSVTPVSDTHSGDTTSVVQHIMRSDTRWVHLSSSTFHIDKMHRSGKQKEQKGSNSEDSLAAGPGLADSDTCVRFSHTTPAQVHDSRHLHGARRT